jgi:hypothetical protein
MKAFRFINNLGYIGKAQGEGLEERSPVPGNVNTEITYSSIHCVEAGGGELVYHSGKKRDQVHYSRETELSSG